MATSLNGSKTSGIVARAQALFDDLSFTTARQWKAAEPSRKVVGYMPIYVPREIIHAAGMLPLGIVGGGDQLEVIHGDAYYQSYICRIPRSTIELGVSGRLDFVDGMLFPSICDVIRNLSGMWKTDVSQRLRPLLRRAAELQGRDRRQLLRQRAGRAAARSRRAARQADHRRRAAPFDRALQREPPAGARALRLPRRAAVAGAGRRGLSAACAPGWCCRSSSTSAMLRDYLAAARAEERPRRDNCRVVLTGVFCEQPPLNLIKSLELAGCYVVDDDLLAGHALAHRRRSDRRRSAAQPRARVPASFRIDGGEVRARPEGEGPASGARGASARAPRA